MAYTVSTTLDGKPITAEQFYAEARKWAAFVRNVAKANATRFKKGKTKQNHTYKTGKKAGKSETKVLRLNNIIPACFCCTFKFY
ncbi:MAG: hypothetical protein FWC10_03115 [Lentimicrobiaceae bacterium]|nr:hypothetical protein [Lentimicrobiaceae bacterium]